MKIAVFGGKGSIGAKHVANISKLGHMPLIYDKADPVLGTKAAMHMVLGTCDAIVIATPTKCHAKDLETAIEFDKHVLVEKPIAFDSPETITRLIHKQRDYEKDVRETGREPNELIIATAFNLRFHSCVKKAKEMIPELGKIKFASFTVNQKTTREPYLMDGIIRNWCSHEIDLAHYLLGPGTVESCEAPVGPTGKDTVDTIIFMNFPSVTDKVIIKADYYSDPEARYFWIEGENKNLYVDLVKRNIFVKDIHNGKVDDPRQVFGGFDSFDQNYIEEMATFINSIQDKKHHEPLATAEDGVRALETVLEARRWAGLPSDND